MIPKHTNPKYPRNKYDRKKNKSFEYWARAPYNFVPLPDLLITVDKPLSYEKFQGESGFIELEIETLSPTFIRGTLTLDQSKRFGHKKADVLSEKEKIELADFYSLQSDDLFEGHPKPSIPGSSLRGLLRTIVEIISYSKVRWVNDSDHISFRAVALGKEDPLSQPYKDMLAGLSAGYLLFEDNQWKIIPAMKPKDLKFSEKGPYLKVKKYLVGLKNIPGFKDFDDPNYEPKSFPVKFDATNQYDKNGKPYTAITNIGGENTNFQHTGTLVCTGNMLETDKGTTNSPRANFSLVLQKSNLNPIPIPENVLEDYFATLTDYQKSQPFDSKLGFIKAGLPIFYSMQNTRIVAIGHTPNFRVPARRPGANRASTPKDFVPDFLLDNNKIDIADSIFGWVSDEKEQKSMAGRVFIEDAKLLDKINSNIWYDKDFIIPQILGTPKPTTFAHYLVQDSEIGNPQHDPDKKVQLAHYGTSNSETQIRGYKWYWHKGQQPDIKLELNEKDFEEKKKQLTKIRPLNPGVKFTCKVHFENLRSEELGALLWAISIPSEKDKKYHHKLGMGKPLGLGSVKITIKSVTGIKRLNRYKNLLAMDINVPKWHLGGAPVVTKPYIKAFEEFVVQKVSPQQEKFSEIPRISDLLIMLEWDEKPQEEWLEWLRYLSIEHPKLENEYKERPVLPTPSGVFGIWSKQQEENTKPNK